MTEFSSLKEALDFQKKCPYCHEKLQIRTKEHVGKIASFHHPELRKNVLYFDQGLERFSINLKTNEIKGLYATPAVHCRSIRLDCMSCWQYYHIFNIGVALPSSQLDFLILNNVGLKRIINGFEFRVKTSRSLNETLFCRAECSEPYPITEDVLEWNEKTIRLVPDIVMPFIEVNLKDPDKTIYQLDELSFYV